MIRRSPIFTLFPYTTLFRSQGSGTYGAEIYWYDAAVDGTIIGFGEEFTTDEIIQTESYWVSEVFLDDSSGGGVVAGGLYLTFVEGAPFIDHSPASVGGSADNVGSMGLS